MREILKYCLYYSIYYLHVNIETYIIKDDTLLENFYEFLSAYVSLNEYQSEVRKSNQTAQSILNLFLFYFFFYFH